MSVAPNAWTERLILGTGCFVFGAAFVTIGVELLDVVGMAAIALVLFGALALRRWS
mgnify:CR=1 FL=1